MKALYISILFILTTILVNGQNEKTKPDNSACLKCHGKNYYTYQNTVTEKEVHKRMNPYFILNNKMYENGVHNTFACTDCHMTEYETYPHDAKLKLEAQYTCIDCHGGDENFAKFKFEEIESVVAKSVHGKAMGEEFKCEMCHNPHYYELGARKMKDVEKVIYQSNQMCLHCHNYTEDRHYLLADTTDNINAASHSWLPNQTLHFKKVRCVECHGDHNDSLLVPHLVQSKDMAVKKCVECHSDNSILMSSLYRHEATENRDKLGFFNGALVNNSFVIGANRNFYLNAISIGVFSLVFLIIILHAVLRIFLKK